MIRLELQNINYKPKTIILHQLINDLFKDYQFEIASPDLIYKMERDLNKRIKATYVDLFNEYNYQGLFVSIKSIDNINFTVDIHKDFLNELKNKYPEALI